MEGSVGEFSKELFPLMDDQEPPYEEYIDWLQFAFTGDTKGQYSLPANTAFSLTSPVEGEPMFLLELESLQTL